MMDTMNGDGLWKAIFQFASEKPVDFPSLYSTHEIRKLSLTKLRIPEIQQKIAQFSVRYNLRQQTSSKTWMENEYRIFLWTVLNYSEMVYRAPLQFNFEDWNLIAGLFDKSPILCNYFYLCSRKGRNNPWSEEQDKFLCQVMKLPEYKGKWTDIGILLFVQTGTSCFRKPKAIRQRWLNHLNPEIVKYQWTLQEDLTVFKMVLEEGKRWSKISRSLKNRSEHSIKNRYNGLIGQKVRNSNCETKALKEEKIIKSYIENIKTLLQNQKKEDKYMENIEEEDKKQVEEFPSLFNCELNSLGLCFFQPTLIIQPKNTI